MKKIILLNLIILFLASMAWAQEKCEAPIWNVGDSWTYEFTMGHTETRSVVDLSNDLLRDWYSPEVKAWVKREGEKSSYWEGEDL